MPSLVQHYLRQTRHQLLSKMSKTFEKLQVLRTTPDPNYSSQDLLPPWIGSFLNLPNGSGLGQQ